MKKFLIVNLLIGLLYVSFKANNKDSVSYLKIQHKWVFSVTNSNFNYFQWNPYFGYGPSHKAFPSMVVTDFNFNYNVNFKNIEMGLLYKVIPNSYPFGTRELWWLMLGAGRKYHKRWYYGLKIGIPLRAKASRPLHDKCPSPAIIGQPCYPEYEYGKLGLLLLQLESEYKLSNKCPIALNVGMSMWNEWYQEGKSPAAFGWLVFNIGISCSLFKKPSK